MKSMQADNIYIRLYSNSSCYGILAVYSNRIKKKRTKKNENANEKNEPPLKEKDENNRRNISRHFVLLGIQGSQLSFFEQFPCPIGIGRS